MLRSLSVLLLLLLRLFLLARYDSQIRLQQLQMDEQTCSSSRFRCDCAALLTAKAAEASVASASHLAPLPCARDSLFSADNE